MNEFKTVYYKHMMMIDTAYHIVFQVDGKIGHVRTALGGIMSMSIADDPKVDKLQIEVEKLVGEGVTLVNLQPDWANIREADGTIAHPFEDRRIKSLSKELPLAYSNFFNESWRRWFPKRVETKIEAVLSQLEEHKITVEFLERRLNLMTDKDYAEEKLKS